MKALALLKDGSKQSSVVTKRFTVYEAEEADNDETEEEEEDMVHVCCIITVYIMRE